MAGKKTESTEFQGRVVCDYFVISSISLSIVHVSLANFKPTAGVHPNVEWILQKLYAVTNSAIA